MFYIRSRVNHLYTLWAIDSSSTHNDLAKFLPCALAQGQEVGIVGFSHNSA